MSEKLQTVNFINKVFSRDLCKIFRTTFCKTIPAANFEETRKWAYKNQMLICKIAQKYCYFKVRLDDAEWIFKMKM